MPLRCLWLFDLDEVKVYDTPLLTAVQASVRFVWLWIRLFGGKVWGGVGTVYMTTSALFVLAVVGGSGSQPFPVTRNRLHAGTR